MYNMENIHVGFLQQFTSISGDLCNICSTLKLIQVALNSRNLQWLTHNSANILVIFAAIQLILH